MNPPATHNLLTHTFLTAELKIDVYDDKLPGHHRRLWEIQFEGDWETHKESTPMLLDVLSFPLGTRVLVKIPLCPVCTQDAGMCECGFNWVEWSENEYS